MQRAEEPGNSRSTGAPGLRVGLPEMQRDLGFHVRKVPTWPGSGSRRWGLPEAGRNGTEVALQPSSKTNAGAPSHELGWWFPSGSDCDGVGCPSLTDGTCFEARRERYRGARRFHRSLCSSIRLRAVGFWTVRRDNAQHAIRPLRFPGFPASSSHATRVRNVLLAPSARENHEALELGDGDLRDRPRLASPDYS